MSRSIFGWDLPPGCSMRDIERAAGGDLPPCCENCQRPDEELCETEEQMNQCPEYIALCEKQDAQNKAEADGLYQMYLEDLEIEGKLCIWPRR